MAKRKHTYKQEEVYPSRRVWVVSESFLKEPETVIEAFGYNDWDIYHGA